MLLIFDSKIRKNIILNPKGVFWFFVFSIVFIFPNLFWNYGNGWITFSHTADNANFENYNFNIFRGFEFLLIQILMLGPVLFIGFLINIKNFKIDFENIYLLSFSLPILAIVFFESVLVRANANWAAPALISLLIFFYRLTKNYRLIININFYFNLVLGLLFFFTIATSMPLKVYDRISGAKEFALEIANITNKTTLVVNDRMLFASLSYELKDRPIKILMPYNPKKRITNHFQITSKLQKDEGKKFYLIGSLESISYLSKKHRAKLIKKVHKKFISEQIEIYEIIF